MSFRTRRTVDADDRGSEPIGLAIIGPATLLLLGLLVVGGRIAIAAQSIAGVAANAARDASIARSPAQAILLAQSGAITSLAAQNLHCQGGPDVVVDTSGFSAPPGTLASIQVHVTCVVLLNAVGMPGLPGARTLRDHATSPLDPYRAISLSLFRAPHELARSRIGSSHA